MKRFSLVLGAWILFPLMAYAASQWVVPLPDTITDHVPYITQITEFAFTTVCFIAALTAFEMVYHGYRRSLSREFYIGLVARVRAIAFVACTIDALAEVQRSRRRVASYR